MAASVFGSGYLGGLFHAGDADRLFSDSAEIRAMLLVEGALAKVQGGLGVIPEISGQAIHRASLEIQIDPVGLRSQTATNAVVIPSLVAAFRDAMQAPEHAQYVHWGATSQDIIDTALMLRLRQALTACEETLEAVLLHMANAAEAHAETPMAARTWGQHATLTSWGGVLAQWGHPLADARDELAALRPQSLWVSLSGASGTASALGPQADQTRAALADALGLRDPMRSWHTDRGPVLRIMHWMARVVATLAAYAGTVNALSMSEVTEIDLGGAGASSTMPQKQNPVQPGVILALNAQISGAISVLQSAAAPIHQRDGGAWMSEWQVVPQIGLATLAALTTAEAMAQNMSPRIDQMRDNLNAGQGMTASEALSFALAAQMPRPDAQTRTKALIAEARRTSQTLASVAYAAYPDLPDTLFDPAIQLGQAPAAARAFAQRILARS